MSHPMKWASGGLFLAIVLDAGAALAQSPPPPAAPSPAPAAPPSPAPAPVPSAAPGGTGAPAPDAATLDAKLHEALEKSRQAIDNARADAFDEVKTLRQESEAALANAEKLSTKDLRGEEKTALARIAVRARLDLADEISAAVCGAGGKRPGCFFYGIIVASGSLTTISIGDQHGGVTAHAIAAAAIPTLGYRLLLDKKGRFNADFGLLSMLASKDLLTLSNRKGCRATDGAYEALLPCEGNAATIPVLGAFAGITAGTTDLGIVTLMLTGGLSRTTLDSSIHGYAGLTVGLVNFSRFLNY